MFSDPEASQNEKPNQIDTLLPGHTTEFLSSTLFRTTLSCPLPLPPRITFLDVTDALVVWHVITVFRLTHLTADTVPFISTMVETHFRSTPVSIPVGLINQFILLISYLWMIHS